MLDFKIKFLKQKFTAPCMQKTPEQRIFIVEQYILTGSRISVRRAFANQFRKNIDVKTVDRVMEKWRRKGSILNQNKGNSGPKRSVRIKLISLRRADAIPLDESHI